MLLVLMLGCDGKEKIMELPTRAFPQLFPFILERVLFREFGMRNPIAIPLGRIKIPGWRPPVTKPSEPTAALADRDANWATSWLPPVGFSIGNRRRDSETQLLPDTPHASSSSTSSNAPAATRLQKTFSLPDFAAAIANIANGTDGVAGVADAAGRRHHTREGGTEPQHAVDAGAGGSSSSSSSSSRQQRGGFGGFADSLVLPLPVEFTENADDYESNSGMAQS